MARWVREQPSVGAGVKATWGMGLRICTSGWKGNQVGKEEKHLKM